MDHLYHYSDPGYLVDPEPREWTVPYPGDDDLQGIACRLAEDIPDTIVFFTKETTDIFEPPAKKHYLLEFENANGVVFHADTMEEPNMLEYMVYCLERGSKFRSIRKI